MIVAIEGMIPSGAMNGRRHSTPGGQPAAPPVEAEIYNPQSLREQQHEPLGEEPMDPVAATKTQPAAAQVPEPELAPEPAPKPANGTSSPSLDRNQPSVANALINTEKLNQVLAATGYVFDAVLDKPGSLRLSVPLDRRFSGRRR
jgi:hypothetical protein